MLMGGVVCGPMCSVFGADLKRMGSCAAQLRVAVYLVLCNYKHYILCSATVCRTCGAQSLCQRIQSLLRKLSSYLISQLPTLSPPPIPSRVQCRGHHSSRRPAAARLLLRRLRTAAVPPRARGLSGDRQPGLCHRLAAARARHQRHCLYSGVHVCMCVCVGTGRQAASCPPFPAGRVPRGRDR